MGMYKVEICGVNTSQLPLLTNEEKTELFEEIYGVRPVLRQRKNTR